MRQQQSSPRTGRRSGAVTLVFLLVLFAVALLQSVSVAVADEVRDGDAQQQKQEVEVKFEDSSVEEEDAQDGFDAFFDDGEEEEAGTVDQKDKTNDADAEQVVEGSGVILSDEDGNEDDEPWFEEEEDIARDKYESLVSQWQANVVQLDGTSYAYLVEQPPRAYDIIVLITADESKCPDCKQAAERYQRIAESYWSKLQSKRAVMEAPLIFAKVSASTIFSSKEMKTTPSLVFSPRTHNLKADGEGMTEVVLPQSARKKIKIDDASAYSSRDIAGVIRIHAKLDVSDSTPKDADNLGSIMWLMVLFMLCSSFFSNYDYIMNGTEFWIGVSLLVYTTAISGFMFCIIRGALPFYLDGTGKLMFFHPQRGQQFILEGLFIACMQLICAACLYAMVIYVPLLPTAEERKSGLLTAVVIFVLVFVNIVTMFRYKSPWYMRFS